MLLCASSSIFSQTSPRPFCSVNAASMALYILMVAWYAFNTNLWYLESHMDDVVAHLYLSYALTLPTLYSV